MKLKERKNKWNKCEHTTRIRDQVLKIITRIKQTVLFVKRL